LSGAVFYTVCDEKYFVGLVGLIASLRQLGHDERIVVLDCGLNSGQKALLDGHCELVAPPKSEARNVAVLKPFMVENDSNRPEIAIFIDSDMIVTRRLDAAIAVARAGKICVFTDPDPKRWFSDWSTVFPMQAPLRREPYCTSSFVAASTQIWPQLFARWWAYCTLIVGEASYQEGRAHGSPVAQIDQDALNALLMSEIPAGVVYSPPAENMVQASFQRARVVDADTLECAYRCATPWMLHWSGKSKPWLWRETWAWTRFETGNAYVLLLRQLLTSDRAPIRVPDHYLPLRLRRGRLGAATFRLRGAAGRSFQLAKAAARTLRRTIQRPGAPVGALKTE